MSTTRTPLIEQPGMIGIVSGDRSTYPQFAGNLMGLQMPPGTRINWKMASGGKIALRRSEIATEALDSGCGWLFFIDDDHTFSPETLLRLLQHDCDVVTPLVSMRTPPHLSILIAPFPVTPEMTDDDLREVANGPDVRRVALTGHQLALRGLVEVGHGGAGGMLIARHVLEALSVPHFMFGASTPSGLMPGEDSWFCLRARRAGFKVFVDTGTPLGHLTTFAVWPVVNDAGTQFRGVLDPLVSVEHNATYLAPRASLRHRLLGLPNWL